MDSDDLFYIKKYDSNFLENFKSYLLNHKIFSLNYISEYNKKNIDYYISFILDNKTAKEMFNINDLFDLTVGDILNFNNYEIENIVHVKKLLNKIVSESEYVPEIHSDTIKYYYDIIHNNIDFYCSFILSLRQ